MEIEEEIKNEINSTATIIARELECNDSIFVNIQIPSECAQYDVLFSYGHGNYGTHQRGIRGDDLLIAIMGYGAYGFNISIHDTDPGYYNEKLKVKSNYLGMLFNAVRKKLKEGA